MAAAALVFADFVQFFIVLEKKNYSVSYSRQNATLLDVKISAHF